MFTTTYDALVASAHATTDRRGRRRAAMPRRIRTGGVARARRGTLRPVPSSDL